MLVLHQCTTVIPRMLPSFSHAESHTVYPCILFDTGQRGQLSVRCRWGARALLVAAAGGYWRTTPWDLQPAAPPTTRTHVRAAT